MEYYKMLRFVKQIFVLAMMFFGCNTSIVNLLNTVSLNAVPLNVVPLKCASRNNQEWKIRP